MACRAGEIIKLSEDKIVEPKTTEVMSNWEKDKPASEDLTSEAAVNDMQVDEGEVNRLKEERDNVKGAEDSKGERPHKETSRVYGKSWETVRDNDQGAKEVLEKLNESSNSFKQQGSLELACTPLMVPRTPLKMNMKDKVSIGESKHEAIKERLCKMLIKTLSENWSLNEMQQGKGWNIELAKKGERIMERLHLNKLNMDSCLAEYGVGGWRIHNDI